MLAWRHCCLVDLITLSFIQVSSYVVVYITDVPE